MVKLVVEGSGYQVNDKIKEMMIYVTQFEAIEKKDAIPLQNVSKATFEAILEACKVTDCQFPKVHKVNSDRTEELIGPALTKFFNKLSYKQLNSMHQALQLLKMEGLRNNLNAFLASKIYFEPTLKSFEKKSADLGIKKTLTSELAKQYRERFLFLN